MKSIAKLNVKEDTCIDDSIPKKPHLTQMKSVKQLSSSTKLYGQVNEFLDIEKKKLNIDDASNMLYLNTMVLKEVMQDCEYHFVYGNELQRQTLKNEAVSLLLLEYFDNNEDVLNRFKELIFKKVSRYGYFRRLCVRLFNSVFKKRLM